MHKRKNKHLMFAVGLVVFVLILCMIIIDNELSKNTGRGIFTTDKTGRATAGLVTDTVELPSSSENIPSEDQPNTASTELFFPDNMEKKVIIEDFSVSTDNFLNCTWSDWKDIDNPGGTGDWEQKSLFPDICAVPLGVECKTLDGTDWTETGQVVICDPLEGSICQNADNTNTCLDYKVRFCCSADAPDVCIDADIDGYFAINPNCPEGNDCNDNNNQTSPAASEVCNNANDDNCDGSIDENCPATNLLIDLRFDNNTLDSSGNGYDGESEETVFVDGIKNQGILFVQGSVVVPFNRDLTSGSVGFWVKTNEEIFQIFFDGNGNNVDSSPSFEGGQNGSIKFYVNNDCRLNSSIDLNEWTHFVGTWDGKKNSVYKNGELQKSAKCEENEMAIDRFSIGGRLGQFPTKGIIDEVKVYDYALSDSEVQALYQSYPMSCEDGTTRDCSTGAGGFCDEGTQLCTDNQWGQCAPVDQECSCDSDVQCTLPDKFGQCGIGLSKCNNGLLGICTQVVFPEEEVCGNEVDEDCDGEALECDIFAIGDTIEAEFGELVGNYEIRSSSNPSIIYIYQKTDTQYETYFSYDFIVYKTQEYIIEANIGTRSPGSEHNSFYVGVDSEYALDDNYIYDTAISESEFVWDQVKLRGAAEPLLPKTYTFTEGQHTITFYGREPETYLNAIRIMPYETEINVTNNTKPTVTVGSDIIINSSTIVALTGSATDDGKPNGTLTYKWTQTEGTPTDIGNHTQPSAYVEIITPDVYTYKLEVSDGELTGYALLKVTYNQTNTSNAKPTVTVGPDISIKNKARVTLSGSATDDGKPNGTLTYKWTQTEGTEITIENSTQPTAYVDISQYDEYVFKLEASDGELTDSGLIEVTYTKKKSGSGGGGGGGGGSIYGGNVTITNKTNTSSSTPTDNQQSSQQQNQQYQGEITEPSFTGTEETTEEQKPKEQSAPEEKIEKSSFMLLATNPISIIILLLIIALITATILILIHRHHGQEVVIVDKLAEVRKYVHEMRARGYKDDVIKEKFLKVGWKPSDIEEIFKVL